MSATVEPADPTPAPLATPVGSGSAAYRAWLGWAWLLLPLACHFGYSWIGFNPTDDGWLLAIARRFADGQVPHRDFIFVFPPLSALLQVPLIWWGGDHVLWISRLWGWIVLAAVCWLWSGRVLGATTPRLLRFLVYAGGFLLAAHTFPIMAWHSIDGLFICTRSILLAARGGRALPAAFFVAGVAALCRQNFVLFPPLLLLAIGGPVRFWFVAGILSALPSLLYALTMVALGANDFFHQVYATSGFFFPVAFLRFVADRWFLGGAAAAVLAWSWRPNPAGRLAALGRSLPILVLGIGAFWLAIGLGRNPLAYQHAVFVYFGAVIGATSVVLVRGVSARDRLTLVAGLGLSWVCAISIGYNTPALALGILLLLAWRLVEIAGDRSLATIRYVLPASTVFVLVTAMAFSRARQHYPYRDRPIDQLACAVGDVMPGAAGLRTNQLTYDTMAELAGLTQRFENEHRVYGILTDFSAVWVRSKQPNPLPCEWPQETALGYDPALFRRFFDAIRDLPPGSRLIVQKFLVSDYSWRLAPIPEGSYYFVQNWVRSHYQKVGETMFFEIYLPSTAPPATALHR